MEFTYEKLEKNIIKTTFNITKSEWEDAVNKSYEQNKGKFKIQGFRNGKAPRKVIEKSYGEGIFYDDAIEIAFSKVYREFLEKEQDIQPIDNPEINIEKFDENGLVITAKVDIMPEIHIENYKGIEIKKSKAKVKKEDIDAEIEKARNKQARFIEVNSRETINGDLVNIDFCGSVDGVKFEGGEAKNYKLELGSNSFIPGFEEQLIGMEIGKEKTINVTFPQNYPAQNLAGKQADFEIKLNKIEEKQLPELNDEFASGVSEFNTLEEYKSDIKIKLEKTLEEKIEHDAENQLIETIVDSCKLEVPDVLVERQLDANLRDLEMRLNYQGIQLDDYAKYSNTTVDEIRNSRKAETIKAVKTRLVLEEIIKKENLFVTPGEINETLSTLANKYKKTLEQYKQQLGEKQLAYIENDILFNKIMKFLKENNNII